MFSDLPFASLEESRVTWDNKKEKSAVLLGRSKGEVHVYRQPRDKQFTVLEDFVLRVLEQGLGKSDEEIAQILCLEAADIDSIIASDALKTEVEGDASRRSLPDNFTRQDPDDIDLGEQSSKERVEVRGNGTNKKKVVEWAEEFGRWAKPGKSKQGEPDPAGYFSVQLEAFRYNDGEMVFLSNRQAVPSILKHPLAKLKVFRNAKSAEAPPEARCHRNEFWLWLEQCLLDQPMRSVTIESTEHGAKVVAWLREKMDIDADWCDTEEGRREALWLSDERFELHGDFVGRVQS